MAGPRRPGPPRLRERRRRRPPRVEEPSPATASIASCSGVPRGRGLCLGIGVRTRASPGCAGARGRWTSPISRPRWSRRRAPGDASRPQSGRSSRGALGRRVEIGRGASLVAGPRRVDVEQHPGCTWASTPGTAISAAVQQRARRRSRSRGWRWPGRYSPGIRCGRRKGRRMTSSSASLRRARRVAAHQLLRALR